MAEFASAARIAREGSDAECQALPHSGQPTHLEPTHPEPALPPTPVRSPALLQPARQRKSPQMWPVREIGERAVEPRARVTCVPSPLAIAPCDRITYSWAWRRLDGVTQVLTPYSDYPTWHNRLTHSEKVAQVSRTIAATVLQRERSALIRKLGGIDVYVCEAAGLAHDLGHPPFGHIGEETLIRNSLERSGI